jgi:hypothetical protein
MTKPTPEEKWCNWCKQEHGWNKDCPSPSPEARVDWAEQAKDLTNKFDVFNPTEYWAMQDAIAKALSAAFEKGREAR